MAGDDVQEFDPRELAAATKLFELKDTWEALGWTVKVQPDGDLVFCSPGKVCVEVDGGLLRRLLRLGRGLVERVIKRALGGLF